MSDCRRCILVLTVSLSRVDQMEVTMFSKYRFASSLYEILWNTSMSNFIGFVIISLASSFYIFPREGGLLYGLLLGEGNVESTSNLCRELRRGLGGVM